MADTEEPSKKVEIPAELLTTPRFENEEGPFGWVVVIFGAILVLLGVFAQRTGVLKEATKDVAGHELVELAVIASFGGAIVALAAGVFFACIEATKPLPPDKIAANLAALKALRDGPSTLNAQGLLVPSEVLNVLGPLAESWDKVRRSTVMFVAAVALAVLGTTAAVMSDGVADAADPSTATTVPGSVAPDDTTAPGDTVAPDETTAPDGTTPGTADGAAGGDD